MLIHTGGTGMRELSLGVSGADVRRWERFLDRARTFDKAPTGFFGPDLAAATEGYQRASGLETTGRADAATLGHALQNGLLDRDLDEPANASHPAPAASKTSRWTVMGPVMVAAAAAVGTFVTSVGVEFVKHQTGLEAERTKLQNVLIQQALRVETPAGAISWRNNEAQLEVVSRLTCRTSLRGWTNSNFRVSRTARRCTPAPSSPSCSTTLIRAHGLPAC
jgi:hypothetical protein